MGDIVWCECGFEARAEDTDGLVAAMRQHAWEAHGMPLSYDEAVTLAVRKGHEGAAPSTIALERPDG